MSRFFTMENVDIQFTVRQLQVAMSMLLLALQLAMGIPMASREVAIKQNSEIAWL